MCGLTGFFTARERTRDGMTAAIEKMAATLVHRGPDDFGAFIDEQTGVALGFRRLAIVDLSPLGHQPMEAASGRCTMAYNGEVYNYRLLRAELEHRGIRFRGSSDTEVILAGFDVWGVRPTIERGFDYTALHWADKQKPLREVADPIGQFQDIFDAPPLAPDAEDDPIHAGQKIDVAPRIRLAA